MAAVTRGRSPGSRRVEASERPAARPEDEAAKLGVAGEPKALHPIETALTDKVSQILSRRVTRAAAGSLYAQFEGGGWKSVRQLPPAPLTKNLLVWRAPADKSDVATLTQLGVTHVLNCAGGVCDVAGVLPPHYVIQCLRARDAPDYDLIGEHLDEATAFLDEALSSPGGVVLVHCQYGQNRSAALAMAYLIRREGMQLLSLLEQILTLRPPALTNQSFLEQLVKLAAREQTLQGRGAAGAAETAAGAGKGAGKHAAR